MSLKVWLLLILLSVLWGGSFFFTEIALEELPVFMLVLLRVLIAALLLFAFVVIRGQIHHFSLKTCSNLLIMGFLNNALPFTLIVWGQVYIDSGIAAILNATTPLFTVMLANFMTSDEKFTKNKFAGVVLGFIGVVFLIGPSALGGSKQALLGQVAVLGAAISYALAGIWGKRLRALPVGVSSAGMLMGSSILMLFLCWFKGELIMPEISLYAWYNVLALTLLSTALAYLLYFYILNSAGATNLLLVTFLIPVSALLLGVLILGEVITMTIIVGLILILLGLVMIDGRIIKLH